MTFSERVRHPSGALTVKDKKTGRKIFLWIVVIVVALYVLWRAGFFSKAASASQAPAAIPNPYRWS
jgi:hypothetical protein